MVTFVAVALGILMLGGASYRLRIVARGWNDRARAENLSMGRLDGARGVLRGVLPVRRWRKGVRQ
jgi:hypothetical protein